MDNKEFGLSFPSMPEKVAPSNPERRELLEAPRQWVSFFNDTLSNYLKGEEPLPHEDFYDKAVEYISWSVPSLDRTITRLNQLDDGKGSNSAATEMNFHRLNGPVLSLWHRMLYNSVPLTEHELTGMQVHLAAEIAPSVREIRNTFKTTSTKNNIRYSDAIGFVTEVDTLIIGLEIMKEHPELVIIPAPSRFEANTRSRGRNGSRNSDLIAIDVEERQARGIQIKTALTFEGGLSKVAADGTLISRRTKGYADYDEEYVTLVDGFRDLGNSAVDITRVVAMPGQIALSVLAEQPIKQNPSPLPNAEYMRSRAIAREIMRGRKSFVAQATRHITQRVLHDIYKSPVAHQTPSTLQQEDTPDTLVS